MKLILTSLLVFISVSLLFFLSDERDIIQKCGEEVIHRFEEFKAKFGKKYDSQVEEEYRRSVFHTNLHLIESLKQKHQYSFEIGVNEFSDLTQEEFNAIYKGFKTNNLQPVNLHNTSKNSDLKTQYLLRRSSNSNYQNNIKLESSTLPDSIDWRDKNAVTQVKHQGKCEGCWAFSTIGGLEGAYAIKTGKLQDFSVQQIIDCQRIDAVGCHGGDIQPAFSYVKNFGIQSQKDYPFVENDNQNCQYDKLKVIYKPDNVSAAIENNGIKIMELLAKQPVSICLNSNQQAFTHYTGGIYQIDNCSTVPDHCVLLVGYGVTSEKKKYWVIKNSWGEGWGEKGYMKILRNEDETAGMCGVTAYAMIPII